MNEGEKEKILKEVQYHIERSRNLYERPVHDQRREINNGRENGQIDGVRAKRRNRNYVGNPKRIANQNKQVLSKRRGRSSSQLVSRGQHPNRRRLGFKRPINTSNAPVRNHRRKKRQTRHGVPLTNTTSFENGVVFKEPIRGYKDNGNCVGLRGVEYVGPISIYTTANATPGAIGDIVYMLPLSPLFLPGTDLYKEAQLWEKWRWKRTSVRYIPSCPSTTNGALIIWGETDLARPAFGLLTDGATKVRTALARVGAKMFHPFSEIDIQMPQNETDNLVWYDTYLDPDVEQTVPYQLFVMLESPITDPNASTVLSVGQVLIDYEIEFCSKSLIDGPTPTPNVTTIYASTATLAMATLTAGDPVTFRTAGLGVAPDEDSFYVIYFAKRVFNVTLGAVITVLSRYTESTTTFGSQGSIMYGFNIAPGGAMYVTPSIVDAIYKNVAGCFYLNGSVSGTNDLTYTVIVSTMDMTDLL